MNQVRAFMTTLIFGFALVANPLVGCGTVFDGGDGSGGNGAPGGGDNGGSGGGAASTGLLSGPSHSSSIDLSQDDSRVVVANHDVGTASVLGVTWPAGANGGAPTVARIAEIPIGGEPSQVSILPGGTAAVVLSRRDGRLVRIDGVASTEPTRGKEASVGSEPTGLALSPTGKTAWVTSWVDGTVVAVDTATMAITATVDLNVTLAASNLLGTGLQPRPALAHPRSIAITNDGDGQDDDETAWVTEYYAQQKDVLAADGANADTSRVGVVYKIPLSTKQAQVVMIPALADVGFHDHNDGVTGCFPNQLQNIHIQGAFGYVLSICASPKGPVGPFTGPAFAACTGTGATCPGGNTGSCVSSKCTTNCTADAQCGANGGKCVNNVCAANTADIKTTVIPAVSVIDLGGAKTIATVNLASTFEQMFVARGLVDDASRRMPLNASDIAFVPGTVTAYVAANGADALFKIDFNATYEAAAIDSVGDAKAPFITLSPPAVDASKIGRLPTGVMVTHKPHGPRYAFVANELTRNVSVIDLEAQAVAGLETGAPVVAESSAPPTDPAEQDAVEGKRMFATGLGRWSMKGQAWISCVSCHTDGLSDNVTWFFPRGARQPNSLDGSFASKDPTDMRIQNWTAINDELADHEAGAARGTAGGVGAIVKDLNGTVDSRIPFDKLGHAGLSGSAFAAADPANPAGLPNACATDDWKKVLAFVQRIRSPHRPSTLDPAKVNAGKDLYAQGNCAGCHSGPKWTISRVFYTPDMTNTVNNALKTTSWAGALAAGFPAALAPASTPAAQTMRYLGAAAADFDQLTCALRPVGTFGVAETGVGVAELRKDMTTAAQGNETDGKGFNVPSLLSTVTGAPYLHAGNARTLEALLSPTFATHLRALAPGFLADDDPARATKVAALVQYLLSIDEDQAAPAIPATGPQGGVLCAAP